MRLDRQPQIARWARLSEICWEPARPPEKLDWRREGETNVGWKGPPGVGSTFWTAAYPQLYPQADVCC